MTPAETAAWDAEIDAREGRVRFIHPCYIEPVFRFLAPKSHALIYSRLRERTVYDPTYRPRHMSHRADVALITSRHRTEEQRVDQAMRAGIEEGA